MNRDELLAERKRIRAEIERSPRRTLSQREAVKMLHDRIRAINYQLYIASEGNRCEH